MKPIAIRAQALHAYTDQWTLIPLHRYIDATKHKGRTRKDGKRPLDFNWTVKPYTSADVVKQCVAQNRNVGVRLTASQLVIDVDPRNGGDEGFAKLCDDLWIDPEIFPRVITGSGGSHYYMSKPDDLSILDTLEGYAGVEFKSRGRQVVAAGSIHPDTRKYYEWDKDAPAVSSLPEAPQNLLTQIRRPQVSAASGGGQYTQAQITTALESLDVHDYRDHDKWFRLMCACHHASNGDARSEFVEWSTSDPNYVDDSEIIGRRWDSLHREKPDGITFRTLNKILADAGKANAQVAGDASGEFEAVDSEDEDEDFEGVEQLSPLEMLNQEYMTVREVGKFCILYREDDELTKRYTWSRMSPHDFVLMNSNHKIESSETGKGKPATVGLGKAWLEWPKRLHFEKVVFYPNKDYPNSKALNLWRGFAYDPSPNGEWSLLQELIFEVLSNGDEEINAYIINWLAYLFQFPERRAEVAVVFRGGRGVGKSTLGNIVAKIIGRHAMTISSPDLITGRFNAHLQDLVFLFADEAIKPQDKTSESRLKAFITEPTLQFEGKGRAPITGLNYLHILMASNEDWVIPAGMDERRFLMSNANSKWQGKADRWSALHDQMENGGYRRMLFDLNRHQLPAEWAPRLVPTTEALIQQKLLNMTPLENFFFNALVEGILPFPYREGPWDTKPIRFFVEDFRMEFSAWCNNNRINSGSMNRSTRALLEGIAKIFPGARTYLRDAVDDAESMVRPSPSDGRAHAVELDPLPACRAAFERQLNGTYNWHAQEDFG